MKILVLDDQKVRHEAYARIYSGNEVVSVYKYSEFCVRLEEDKWDLIHLDHDLGDDVEDADYYVDGWGSRRLYDGIHAVDRILELAVEKYPAEVIVQSVNSDRAVLMTKVLNNAGIPTSWQPFGNCP